MLHSAAPWAVGHVKQEDDRSRMSLHQATYALLAAGHLTYKHRAFGSGRFPVVITGVYKLTCRSPVFLVCLTAYRCLPAFTCTPSVPLRAADRILTCTGPCSRAVQGLGMKATVVAYARNERSRCSCSRFSGAEQNPEG